MKYFRNVNTGEVYSEDEIISVEPKCILVEGKEGKNHAIESQNMELVEEHELAEVS